MNLLSRIKNAAATVVQIMCGWHTNHEPERIDVVLNNGIKLRLHLKSLLVR